MSNPQVWFVYLVRCSDGTLYCGIALDVEKRIGEHNAGKGAKYIVPSRRPVVLVHSEQLASKGEALSREATIKKLSRAAKEKLFAT